MSRYDEIWKDDLLGRREDAEFLISFLSNRIAERGQRGLPRSYVLNLNSPWGLGKTFFLERLAKHLKEQGRLVAEVNAWKDDHAEDPLLAVMAAMEASVRPFLKNKRTAQAWQTVKRSGAAVAVAAVKGAAIHWTRRAIGEGFDAALEEIDNSGEATAAASEEAIADEVKKLIDAKAAALISNFKAGQNSIVSFRHALTRFLASMESAAPLYVLVDELDRCRPSYAIALLERVKHLFDIDNVVFIVATDTSQLHHAVGAVYGLNFDSRRYLLRFFDRIYSFDTPSIQQFVNSLVAQHGYDETLISLPNRMSFEGLLVDAFTYFDLSLRDIDQCFDLLRSVLTVWEQEVPVEIVVLVPLIVGHHRGIDPSFSSDFISKINQSGRKWTITFSSSETVDALGVFQTFAKQVELPLPKIAASAGGAMKGWISDRFRFEFSKRYRNQHYPADPPYSLIRDYPQMVRSAGRLTTKSAKVPP